jgi:hypothetical protein
MLARAAAILRPIGSSATAGRNDAERAGVDRGGLERDGAVIAAEDDAVVALERHGADCDGAVVAAERTVWWSPGMARRSGRCCGWRHGGVA